MGLMTPEAKTTREARARAAQEEAFQRHLAKPETKLLVSLIPESQQPEALTTLMRSAFEAGANHGAGDTLLSMFDALLKDKPRPE